MYQNNETINKLVNKPILIIDFDSTFVSVESLDELFRISLKYNSQKNSIVQKIQNITDLGMNGKIEFAQSLNSRINLLVANNNHINELINFLMTKISPSFFQNKTWLRQNASQIYIVSGGFTDYITPIVAQFGIPQSRVFANQFLYDYKGNIVGYDKNNFLAQDKGKCKQMQIVKPKGEIWAIGDGWTDYELKENNIASKFFGYTENKTRDKVVAVADTIANSLDVIISEYSTLFY